MTWMKEPGGGFPVPPKLLHTGHEFVFPDYVDVAAWKMACGVALTHIQDILSEGALTIPAFFEEWRARDLPDYEERLGKMMLGWSGQGASNYGGPVLWKGCGSGELAALRDSNDTGTGCVIRQHRGDPHWKRKGGTSGEI